MDSLIFRKLNVNDYESFFPLINDFRNTSFTREEFVETLTQIEKSSDIWVLEKEGSLIGTGTILYEHKFIFDRCILAHIEDICIRKEYRACGYGKQIMGKLVEEAKEKGCYKITLDCMEENVPFYEKCNFEKRGRQMTILLKPY